MVATPSRDDICDKLRILALKKASLVLKEVAEEIDGPATRQETLCLARAVSEAAQILEQPEAASAKLTVA
jgi:hypothetical protein